ncbi:unnamed protein product (mitochondrion) [Enteromyxum leei]|uniref:Uncharacterized protein n=1 Tax=Enteromyxum leei TaxID=188704 RepID=A0A1Q2XB84_ENTLE|nr:unnamed protein product [Enteromyxum leei]
MYLSVMFAYVCCVTLDPCLSLLFMDLCLYCVSFFIYRESLSHCVVYGMVSVVSCFLWLLYDSSLLPLFYKLFLGLYTLLLRLYVASISSLILLSVDLMFIPLLSASASSSFVDTRFGLLSFSLMYVCWFRCYPPYRYMLLLLAHPLLITLSFHCTFASGSVMVLFVSSSIGCLLCVVSCSFFSCSTTSVLLLMMLFNPCFYICYLEYVLLVFALPCSSNCVLVVMGVSLLMSGFKTWVVSSL